MGGGVTAAGRAWPALLPAALACLAAVYLEAYPLWCPQLVVDDIQILYGSWTWQATCDNLWVPHNEHTMPLGRLSTWLLVQAAGRVTALPLATTLQGPLALVAGMGLLYLFLRRELGHPFYGLVGMVLFGVTSIYQQAVCWFAASFAVLGLDTLLVGLLAAQGWRRTGRAYCLVACAACAALAPAWFASGILAGPLCGLYLLVSRRQGDKETRRQGDKETPELSVSLSPCLLVSLSRLLVALTPLAGTALFLAVTVPLNAQRILHTPHYEEKTAVEAFHPLTGLGRTGRSLVDNLLLGQLGISGVHVPIPVVIVALAAVAGLAARWWLRAPCRRLLLLGLALVLVSYLLTYSARAEWPYDGHMSGWFWTRYHLLPQLGLALFVCGGLPRGEGRWFRLRPDGTLTGPQAVFLVLLISGLLNAHLPRALLGPPRYWEQQMPVLERIAAVDERCRAHRLSAEAAREVLSPRKLEVPLCSPEVNGWDLLRGSPEPRETTREEAERILEGLTKE